MIGQALRRLEDPRLVTGSGQYVDDKTMPGLLHAVFVRSIEAHARIESVTVEGDLPTGAQIFTSSDLDLTSPMPVQNPSPLIAQPLNPPPLATDEVCYVGQPIAVAVAEWVHDAIDAAEAVQVAYDPLPAIVDYRRALDPDAPPAHDGGDSNLVASLRAGFGDIEAVFASATGTVSITVDQERGAVGSLEGRAVLGMWDDSDAQLVLWTSTQAPHAVHSNLASYLRLSPDDLRVIAPDVGGGFGPKAGVYPEEYVVAALARELGVPVKWTERRREHFVATLQQRGQFGELEAAFDDQGGILGLRAHLIHDLGAYVPYGVVVPMTTLRLISGPYAISAIEAQVDCVFTNATPTGAIRGAGRPNANFAVERVMDAVAAEVGLDRAEVRRRNFIAADDLPYTIGLPGSDGNPVCYDSGDYRRGLEEALRAADLAGFDDRRRGSEERRMLRGYGIASYVEDTGTGPYDGARLEVLTNGDILLETGAAAQGQGHATVFSQIVSHTLGVDSARVRVRGGDTSRYRQGIATVASRTGQTTAAAVALAAGGLAEEIKRRAAAQLEASISDLVLERGNVMVVGQPGSEISLAQLAADAQPKFGARVTPGQDTSGLSAERVFAFNGSAYTYGTHVAEVEIDPETGRVEVMAYTVVHDCGTMLNPMIVDGQIDGGVAHGLGNALRESTRFSDDGQPLATSFMDYLLTSAGEMPPLTKIHFETPAPDNPLGAKGAGEGGTIPVAAAVASAIEHAIGDPAVTVRHYPVTSEWVFSALQGTG
jgi:carbon-monoxide dehydrogenase large subunit